MAASKSKYIWNIGKTKKIKTREIRDFRISYDEELKFYEVNAYGYFGGAVKIFESTNEQECQEFVDSLTEGGVEINGEIALQQVGK
jgi:hypothetical protein